MTGQLQRDELEQGAKTTAASVAVPLRRLLAGGGGKPARLGALLLAALALGALLPPAETRAQEPEPAERTQVALLNPANEDLLLFWDEKELYVQTATRIEKPLAQVAENMTVITAKEIEDMNAHTLADVLNRVPGLFIDFSGQDFNAPALLHIQGSPERLVTVLLDGVVWNYLAGGNAETSNIPVRIIERIEIIKGPASSAWGSALGGVINIITKNAGDSPVPRATLSASYGEANSQDYNAEIYGKLNRLGYYIYGGRQQTDGLRNNRNSDQDRVYGKFDLAPTSDLNLLVTVGYSNPLQNTGDTHADIGNGLDLNTKVKTTDFFVTGAFDYRLSAELSLKGSGHLLQQKAELPVLHTHSGTFSISSLSIPYNSGDLFSEQIYDEQTSGGNLKLLYSGEIHTAVLGLEYSHGNLDQTTNVGQVYQAFGRSATSVTKPNIDKWALFANDTIDMGRLAVTPGVRVDHDTVTGYFVSPSFGATYELAEHTVARASVARGFTSPPLSDTSGGGTFLVANPGLKREEGWSYQVGLESGVADLLQAKVTLFRHDTENAISNTLNAARQVTNIGDLLRQGYELEAETVPLHNISLKAAHAYVHINLHDTTTDSTSGLDNYSYLVGIKYDDRRSLMAQLTGTYVWFEQLSTSNARYDTFIWDFNIDKRFQTSDRTTLDLFLAVHNLFSAPHYLNDSFKNALRWVEGGVRFRF